MILEILKQQQYKVPSDISLIGFTNGELAQHATPKITTVSQHGVYMGEQAMKYLVERLQAMEEDKGLLPRLKTIKTNIMERESTIKKEE